MSHRVFLNWERRPSQPTAEKLRRTILATLDRLEMASAEVHVLITGDERIRDLNRTYRELDRATDVLAFPDGSELPTGRRLLGQIVISLDRAREQAARFGHGELEELDLLVLHGTLHLAGHDHEHDQGEMAALEAELREELLQ